jgi:hypothetical protein
MKRLFLSAILCTIVIKICGQAACNNEDFEGGPLGVITTSNAVSGWSIFKLNYSTTTFPNTTNCTALTATAVTRSNPTSVTIFTNGILDTIIGPTYQVHSVFGTGASNGGEAFNPGLTIMKGNNFLKLGSRGDVPYTRQSVEKTIVVTTANALFRLAYMPVMQQGQGCCDAPSFQVKFFNVTGGNTIISCPSFSLNAPSAQCPNLLSAGMSTSAPTSTLDVYYYQKWKILAVDLTPYIGSTIVCKVAAAFCLNGCSKFAYTYLDAQCSPMEVYVNNTPFPAHTNSVTFSGCGVLTATVVAPPDFSSYQWNGPGGFTSTLSTITTSATGVYTLNIMTSGTCSVITKFINIKLFAMPTVSISTSKTVACRGDAIKLVASGINSYTWNVPGNTATVTTSPTTTSTYTVSGYDINGCLGTAVITQSVNPCLSIDEGSKSDRISIYPNPNKGDFVIRLNNSAKANLTITSLTGQLILNQEVKEGENKIQSQKLVSGVYLYQIIGEGVYSKGKVQIE